MKALIVSLLGVIALLLFFIAIGVNSVHRLMVPDGIRLEGDSAFVKALIIISDPIQYVGGPRKGRRGATGPEAQDQALAVRGRV